jgi:hypothetical protein
VCEYSGTYNDFSPLERAGAGACVSLGIEESRKKQKPPKNQTAVVACGDFVFPRYIGPLFRTQGTLKVGFLSNLQVAGWLFGNHRS